MMKKIKNNSSENKGNFSMLGFFSFVALIITAILLLFNNMLPIFDLSENVTNVLTTIKDCLVLLVIGLNALRFVKNKGQLFKILFLIALIVFIVSIVFIWIF